MSKQKIAPVLLALILWASSAAPALAHDPWDRLKRGQLNGFMDDALRTGHVLAVVNAIAAGGLALWLRHVLQSPGGQQPPRQQPGPGAGPVKQSPKQTPGVKKQPPAQQPPANPLQVRNRPAVGPPAVDTGSTEPPDENAEQVEVPNYPWPVTVPPPEIIDPWSGEPLPRWEPGLYGPDENGNDGVPGQVWWGGRWVDPADARDKIDEALAADRRREQQSQQFQEESQRLSDDWLRNRVQQLQDEALKEKQEKQAEEDAWKAEQDAWKTLDRISDLADRKGYDDLWQRAQDDAVRPDGSIDLDYVNRLRDTLRNRIGRDQTLPDEPQPHWLTETLTNTWDDARHSLAIRIGLGVLTGGSSEIAFQSQGAWEAMQRSFDEAAAEGRDWGYTDALRSGFRQFGRENLPLNTLEAMQDPKATWGQVAMSAAMDLFTGWGLYHTVKNLRGSLQAARAGESTWDALTQGGQGRNPFRPSERGTTPPREAPAPTAPKPPEPPASFAKSDKGAVEANVGLHTSNLGKKASDALNDPELVTKITNSLKEQCPNISEWETKYALKNLSLLEPQTVQPPAFARPGVTNGPNLTLPEAARPALTTAEQVACQKYTTSAYRHINNPLRAGVDPAGPYGEIHQGLQDAFAKTTPFEKPVMLHRGLTMEGDTLNQYISSFQDAMNNGRPVELPGYTSTAVGKIPTHFDGNVKMTIIGKQGLDLKPYTHYPHESEVLLNHLSQFKVHSVENIGGKCDIKLEQYLAGE